MKPTKILSEEHENIIKVINALDKECDVLESGKELDKSFFEKAIDFIRNYADKFHHAKEEDILFKKICDNEGKMHCNPVEQMLHEHDLGRDFVKNMENGLFENDKEKVIYNAREYGKLLREHIFKEDKILYPMADEVIDENDQKEMLKRFKEAEEKKFDKGVKKKYLALVKEFEKR